MSVRTLEPDLVVVEAVPDPDGDGSPVVVTFEGARLRIAHDDGGRAVAMVMRWDFGHSGRAYRKAHPIYPAFRRRAILAAYEGERPILELFARCWLFSREDMLFYIYHPREGARPASPRQPTRRQGRLL